MKKPDKKRALILIDGSNFYFSLRALKLPRHRFYEFDYFRFARWLAGDRKIANRNYYIGVVRVKAGDAASQKLYDDQQKLFEHLESSEQKFNVVRGFIMQTGDRYFEKGVDVRMAVDIVTGACEDKWDEAILVSSDTDLVPAINYAQRHGKAVEYVGFAGKGSNELTKVCEKDRLLTKKELTQFIVKKPAPTEQADEKQSKPPSV